MYQIVYQDLTTHKIYVAYGFSKATLALLYELENEQIFDFSKRFKIIWMLKLDFSWSVFCKCWQKEKKCVYQRD